MAVKAQELVVCWKERLQPLEKGACNSGGPQGCHEVMQEGN